MLHLNAILTPSRFLLRCLVSLQYTMLVRFKVVLNVTKEDSLVLPSSLIGSTSTESVRYASDTFILRYGNPIFGLLSFNFPTSIRRFRVLQYGI